MKKIVGNFIVEAWVERAGSPVAQVNRHDAASHWVKITNLSTLPYDVELEQELPDHLPSRPFSYNIQTKDRWTASWLCVTDVQPVDDKCDLDVHGPAARSKRLLTRTMWSRLATPASATTGSYVADSSAPLPLDVRLTVN